jgi:hypothetical protein
LLAKIIQHRVEATGAVDERACPASSDAHPRHSKGTRPLQKGHRLRIEFLATQLNALSPQEFVKLDESVEILRTILAAWR